jgi:L,D-transpeptidase catalytic domain
MIGSGLVGVAALALGRPAYAIPSSDNVRMVARRALTQNAHRIAKTDVVGVTNFAAPSRTPRFYIVDMASGEATPFLVAHGRGSDPEHTGWVRQFSNDFGSNASAPGAYLTGGYYEGKHGRSMRLNGLDPENNNAEARAIVVHGAWYVSDNMVRDHGKLGRSEGCFAVAETVLPEVLDRLGPGRLLFAGKF